jgi:hypothetical protein
LEPARGRRKPYRCCRARPTAAPRPLTGTPIFIDPPDHRLCGHFSPCQTSVAYNPAHAGRSSWTSAATHGPNQFQPKFLLILLWQKNRSRRNGHVEGRFPPAAVSKPGDTGLLRRSGAPGREAIRRGHDPALMERKAVERAPRSAFDSSSHCRKARLDSLGTIQGLPPTAR